MSDLIFNPNYLILNIDNSVLLHNMIYNLKRYNKQFINYKFNNLIFIIFPYSSLLNYNSIKQLNNNNILEIFKNKPNNILLEYYEITYIFNLIYKNNMNILEINNDRISNLNSVKYILNKKKFQCTYNIELFEAYVLEKSKIDIEYEKYNTLKRYNYFINKKNIININELYDLIYCNIGSYSDSLFFLEEEQSLNIKFIFAIYSIMRLKKGANLILSYSVITTEQSYQIINNLEDYFNKIIIYDPITCIPKLTGTFILLMNYKNNFNLKKYEKKIDEIFKKDPTLGNDFSTYNNQLYFYNLTEYSIQKYKESVKIYINDYKINKKNNELLLKKIIKIMYNKLYNLKKCYYNAYFLINNYANINNPINKIIKQTNYLRTIVSYYRGLELKLIDDNYNNYIKEIVKKIKKNKILEKKISDYISMRLKYNIYNLNLIKLDIAKDYYYHYNLKKSNNDNIFELIDFKKYSLDLFDILENYEDVNIVYESKNLYQIDIKFKNKYKEKKILTQENKNFIQKILAIYLNKVIDTLYDKQESDYYLRKYNL